MKTSNSKTTQNCQTPRAKTGFLSVDRIRNTLRINHQITMPTNQINSLNLTVASHEKEALSNEVETEIKKAQARTYANAILIR